MTFHLFVNWIPFHTNIHQTVISLGPKGLRDFWCVCHWLSSPHVDFRKWNRALPVGFSTNLYYPAGVTGLTSKQMTLSFWCHRADIQADKPLWAYRQNQGQVLPRPSTLLDAAWSWMVSGGRGFICFLRWYEDHPLGTRNATGQSGITLCELVHLSEQQSLLRMWTQPTLTPSRILMAFLKF